MAPAFLCLIFSACEPLHMDPQIIEEVGLIVQEVSCCETLIVEDNCGVLFQIVEAEGLDMSEVEAGDIIKGNVVVLGDEVFECEVKCADKNDYPLCRLEPF